MLILQLASVAAYWIARFILIGVVIVAPWLIGAVPAQFQLWLTYGVAASFAFWLVGLTIGQVGGATDHEIVVPLPLIFLFLLVALGTIQLTAPISSGRVSSEWAAALRADESSAHDIFLNSTRVISISPHSTRFQVARILIVSTAFFLGAQFFRTCPDFQWLFGAVATVGALQALFGIEQILHSNPHFLGFISLRYGGEPFATFVNRNNAAGFLNICLAAAVGGIILASGKRLQERSPSQVIIFTVLAALIMAGIVASTSRGGMLATVIGLVVICPWLYRQFGRWSLAGTVGTGVIVVAMATWFHFAESAKNRLETLRDFSSALSGRWDHWTNTSQSLIDRPWLGSGWGTYRYANLPYQRQETAFWFWNADNQFFEVAVEGGLTGFLLIVGCIASLAIILIRLARKEKTSLASSLVASGLFLLVTLTVQETTDFGITLLSLALASGVLAGAISGAAMRLKINQSEFAFPHRFLTSSSVTMTVVSVLVAGTSWAGFELARTQPSLTLCESVPASLTAPDLFEMKSLNSLIEQMHEQSRISPGNAELHFDLARLLIYRSQQQYADQNAEGASLEKRTQAWESAQPERLFNLSQRQTGSEWLMETKDRPFFVNNLPEATRELQLAQNACSWIPGVSFRLVLLDALNSQSTEPDSVDALLRSEALLAAGNPNRLITVGRIALKDHLDELASLCWRRALRQNDRLLRKIVQEARLGWEDDQISLRLLVTPEQLISFLMLTHDIAARRSITAQLETHRAELQASDQDSKQGQGAWIAAHLALLVDQKELAINSLKSAVRFEPFRIQWRLDLAELLMENKDDAGAREQLVFATRLEPRNDGIRKRLEAVIERELRARSAGPEFPTPDVHANHQIRGRGIGFLK